MYAVVLYHAGLGRATGGFVGVDLFFVLSGYLVSNVLLTDLHAHGRVRLLRFYARRARRLIPAAAIAVVGTAGAALLLMPSLDRGLLDGDARAASLWYANWHFLAQSSDYFAVDGPESPFIHFWSLSIEEQFYLAFPLALLVAWKLRPRLSSIAAVAGGGFAVSLTLQLALADDVNRAYLGADARVYQILAGALLALLFWRWDVAGWTARHPEVRAAVVLAAALGLVAFVFVSSSAFDVSVSRRGVAAALVSAVLIGTIEVGGASPVRSALSWRPLQYLGRISYGTYLWHWPVLVLAGTVVDMSPIAAACVSGVVGTALAALSSELVELPVRRTGRLDRVPGGAVAGGVALAAVSGLAIAPALLSWDRNPVVIPRGGGEVVAPGGAVPDLDWEAIARGNPDVPTCQAPDGADCVVLTGDRGTILAIGDSHLRMLIPALTDVAARRGMTLAVDFGRSCPWQDGLLAGEPGDQFSPPCSERRAVTYGGRIEAIDPDVIVLVGFPRSIGIGGVFSDRPAWEGLPEDELVGVTTDATLRRLAADRPVLVVEPLPVLEANPLSCLSGATDVNQCAFAPLPEGVEEQLERALAVELPGLATIDFDGFVCPGGASCPAIIDDIVVHRDRHHLTPEFAVTLSAELDAALATLIGER